MPHSAGGPIRAAYRRAGMNRSQFQRAIGVAYSTILNWERGRTRPNADHLELISKVTGAPVHELLGGALSEPTGTRNRYAALDDFLTTPAGRSMTAAERQTVESVVFHGMTPNISTYHAILIGLRLPANGALEPGSARSKRRKPR